MTISIFCTIAVIWQQSFSLFWQLNEWFTTKRECFQDEASGEWEKRIYYDTAMRPGSSKHIDPLYGISPHY